MSAITGNVERIQKRTLHDEVVSRLRDMIIEGQLPAGSRINESELGLRLGVSRTPLREAIKTLAQEGLVELVPSKGAVVRRFTLQDVGHMLEAIKDMEQSAARRACQRAADAEIAGVLRLHKDMRREYRSRNRLNYYKLNQAIHSELVRIAGNPVIAELHEILQSRLKRIRYLGNQDPTKWDGAMAEHEEMAKALSIRNGKALAEIMGRHMDKTLERVSGSL
jgi:DNA-binding GntR family transcriptional regulator